MDSAPSPEVNRLQALREETAVAECDAFFSVSPPMNQYLTGFMGSTSGVIVTDRDALFLCDFRYVEQAGEEVREYERAEFKGGLAAVIGERLKELGVKTAAFDPACLSVAEWEAVGEAFGGTLTPAPKIAPSLRAVKSPGEIARIRAASELAEGVLADLLETLARRKAGDPPLTEAQLAARFEYEFKNRGAHGAAFDTIALFGPRTSLVHGQPGPAALEQGDVILLDLGCRKDGYCSDLTRTYAFGTIPGAWFEEIYAAALCAQLAALEAVKAGAHCRDVDAAARDVIAEAGYGEYFGHGLGHGVGIEVHEGPRLNTESDAQFKAGMVVTIEPGIYLPGRGGVRIEDLVVVTEDGCDVLTRAPKELRVLAV